MINLRKILLAGFLAVAALGAVTAQYAAAEEAAVPVSAPDDALAQVYGQTLKPGEIKLPQHSKYPPYTWSQLKGYLPEVLPDAQSSTKSPEALCDHVIAAYQDHAIHLETAEEPLIVAAEHVWRDNAAYEVTDRLASPSEQALAELLEKMPERKEQIMKVKDMTARYLTLAILRDAAVKNCPDHAKQKGYPVLTK